MSICKLKILADYYCEIFIDEKIVGVAKRNEAVSLDISAGKHKLKCVATTCKRVYIEQEIETLKDVSLKISFEDHLFAHPDLIVTAGEFGNYYHNFKRFHDVWKDVEIVDQGSKWNSEDVSIGKHIEVIKDGVYGYVNQVGSPANDKFYIIERDGKYGVACGLGTVVSACVYDEIDNYDNWSLTPVKQNGFWGIYDFVNGKMIQECKYEYAYADEKEKIVICSSGDDFVIRCGDNPDFIRRKIPFYSGLCNNMIVSGESGKKGLSDIKGNQVIDPIYHDIEIFGKKYLKLLMSASWYVDDLETGVRMEFDDVDDVISYEIENKDKFLSYGRYKEIWGLAELNGRILTKVGYSYIDEIGEGMLRVQKNGKWGCLNVSGEEVIPCIYDMVGPFSFGRAGVLMGNKWGIMDTVGNLIVPCELDSCPLFIQGQCIISRDDKMGVIDAEGNIIIPCEHDRIATSNYDMKKPKETQIEWGRDEYSGKLDHYFTIPYCAKYNHYYVKKYNGWGLYDLCGTRLLPYIYDDFYTFDEQVIGIKRKEDRIYLSSTCASFVCERYQLIDTDHILTENDGKWKLYRTTGELILDEEFKGFKNIGCGLLGLKKDVKYAIFNISERRFVSEYEYDEFYGFYEDRATVVRDGLHGFIDTNGLELIPCQYGDAWMFVNGIANVEGKIIDMYGHCIWPTEFSY